MVQTGEKIVRMSLWVQIAFLVALCMLGLELNFIRLAIEQANEHLNGIAEGLGELCEVERQSERQKEMRERES
jgi:hypothetical protein